MRAGGKMRATRPQRPHVSRAPQGPRGIRPLNDKQLQRLAGKQTADSLHAAQAPILSAEEFSRARQAAAQQAITGFTGAASKLYRSPADVRQVYADAAQETAGMAGAFSGEAGHALATGEQENAQFRDQMAPGSDAQGEPDVAAAHDASYYLGGYVPGSSLEAQGAAAAGIAESLPTLQVARGEQDLMANVEKGYENDQQYTQAMLDLAAKEPDMRNQILDHLYSREAQKQQLAIQQQAQNLYQRKFGVQTRQENRRLNQEQQRLRISERQGNARIALQAAGLKLSQQRQQFSVKQALKQGHRIDASASRAAGYLVNQAGDPILDGKGQHIPVSATSSGGGGKGGVGSTGYHEAVRATPHLMPTPTEVPSTSPYSVQYKYVAKPGQGTFVQGAGWFTNNPAEATQTGKYTFPEAVKYVMNAYGLKRPAARKALIAGGWKPNGQRPPKRGKQS